MNTKTRLTSETSIKEAIIEMSEGNPGALTCMMEMMDSNPMALSDILYFDSLGIYGSKIYMLWNDCCDRDMNSLTKHFGISEKATSPKKKSMRTWIK